MLLDWFCWREGRLILTDELTCPYNRSQLGRQSSHRSWSWRAQSFERVPRKTPSSSCCEVRKVRRCEDATRESKTLVQCTQTFSAIYWQTTNTKGSKIDALTATNETIVHKAAVSGDDELMEYVLAQGFNWKCYLLDEPPNSPNLLNRRKPIHSRLTRSIFLCTSWLKMAMLTLVKLCSRRWWVDDRSIVCNGRPFSRTSVAGQ